MKTITPYLLKFAIVATILIITFRHFLSFGIENKMVWVIISSAILIFIGMFISGWFFGKKDGEYLPIYDIGFRFHFTTYLIFNLISELWFVFGFNARYERIGYVHTIAIVWGILLLIHYGIYLKTKKNAIDNLDKTNLFE